MNKWLAPTIGLLTAAVIAILSTTPPANPYTWPRLLTASAFVTLLAAVTCAAAMFLTYVAFPKRDPGPIIRRTSATAACFPALIILLQQRSMWAPTIVAFLIWTILPATVPQKSDWKKFAVALFAAVLLQIGGAAALGEESLLAALTLGLAAAPILWRIRQERSLRGPFTPRSTIAIAMILAILASTHYLPMSSGSAIEGAYAKNPSDGQKSKGAAPGFSVGGKYRGVILSPEEEQHTILVPPLPMMGRDPFLLHKDPIGIPFYGVYWFFQYPDKAPDDDAYRTKGSPDKMAFHSADINPLKMEAHQNLGRLIDLSAVSRIDISIRNADIFIGSLAIELILVNTARPSHPSLSLGQVPITSKPPSQDTLSFKIPRTAWIEQFDELTIRFAKANYRATRSPRIAIDRFYLIPRTK